MISKHSGFNLPTAKTIVAPTDAPKVWSNSVSALATAGGLIAIVMLCFSLKDSMSKRLAFAVSAFPNDENVRQVKTMVTVKRQDQSTQKPAASELTDILRQDYQPAAMSLDATATRVALPHGTSPDEHAYLSENAAVHTAKGRAVKPPTGLANFRQTQHFTSVRGEASSARLLAKIVHRGDDGLAATSKTAEIADVEVTQRRQPRQVQVTKSAPHTPNKAAFAADTLTATTNTARGAKMSQHAATPCPHSTAQVNVIPANALDWQEARSLTAPAPEYPRYAVRHHMEAEIKVSLRVNIRGKVERVTFNGPAHQYFKDAVAEAVQTWQFEPAQLNGRAVPVTVEHEFKFSDPQQYVVYLTGSRLPKLMLKRYVEPTNAI